MSDGWSPHKHCIRSMQALLQCWSGLLVRVPTNPRGDEKSKHISWLTTDKLCYREEKKRSNPIAKTKLHRSCFDHRRKFLWPSFLHMRRIVFSLFWGLFLQMSHLSLIWRRHPTGACKCLTLCQSEALVIFKKHCPICWQRERKIPS